MRKHYQRYKAVQLVKEGLTQREVAIELDTSLTVNRELRRYRLERQRDKEKDTELFSLKASHFLNIGTLSANRKNTGLDSQYLTTNIISQPIWKSIVTFSWLKVQVWA
jgi:IS30 family transposase